MSLPIYTIYNENCIREGERADDGEEFDADGQPNGDVTVYEGTQEELGTRAIMFRDAAKTLHNSRGLFTAREAESLRQGAYPEAEDGEWGDEEAIDEEEE